MSESERGQVSRGAADVYEDFFVPALFLPWAERLTKLANPRPGERVLDVACGTGALARAVARRVGPGAVVGVDVNEAMLDVARRRAPDILWRQGRAEALPFDAGSFDVVTCQFGLMFFEDRRGAVREMSRVLRPGGRLVVAVWAALESSPGYAALADLLQRVLGSEAADGLRPPFSLGSAPALRSLLDHAGLTGVEVRVQTDTARFPSLRSWVQTEVKGWTLAEHVSDQQLEALLEEAERELRSLAAADGTVEFAVPALIATASRGTGALQPVTTATTT